MSAPPDLHFTSSTAVVAIFLGVVLTAFLVNRFVPHKRRHVRRAVILALFYFAAVGALRALSFFQLGSVAHVAGEVSELFGAIAVVSVGALVVFDLGLPALGIDAAPIITDLGVGIGYLTAVFFTLHRVGFDFSGIVATSALLTTIVAFSLQGTFSNIVGGVALQVDDSIKVGDWVQLENGRQGKVREIRWRYTVIETRDWDTLIVPNATLLAGTIMILGKRAGEPLQHRMWVYFNVDFRYSPTDVIAAVDEALQAAPIEGAAAEPKPHCICYDFAKDHRDSFAYYAVRYFLKDLARDDPTSSRVRERIFAALRRANIPLAVPAAHLWIEEDSTERRMRKKQQELDKRLRALSAVEILKPLHRDELGVIADKLHYAIFAPGETMTRQGAVAHWLYIVVEGTAEVRINVEGTERSLARIAAPGFFGEMGLMTGAPRMATVIASTEVECYRLEKEAFHKIIAERPEIAAEVSAILAHRQIELLAAKEGLDAESKACRIAAERSRLLVTIQRFFGLEDEQAM